MMFLVISFGKELKFHLGVSHAMKEFNSIKGHSKHATENTNFWMELIRTTVATSFSECDNF
jgi:hypothetical protein